MGLWEQLKTGLNEIKNTAKPDIRYIEKHAERIIKNEKPLIKKLVKDTDKAFRVEMPLIAKLADAIGLGDYVKQLVAQERKA